jgi:hypothetical protein
MDGDDEIDKVWNKQLKDALEQTLQKMIVSVLFGMKILTFNILKFPFFQHFICY